MKSSSTLASPSSVNLRKPFVVKSKGAYVQESSPFTGRSTPTTRHNGKCYAVCFSLTREEFNAHRWCRTAETARNQEEIIRTVRESSENVKKEMKQELSNIALNALHTTLISEHDMRHIIEIAVQRGLELKEQEARKRDCGWNYPRHWQDFIDSTL